MKLNPVIVFISVPLFVPFVVALFLCDVGLMLYFSMQLLTVYSEGRMLDCYFWDLRGLGSSVGRSWVGKW